MSIGLRASRETSDQTLGGSGRKRQSSTKSKKAIMQDALDGYGEPLFANNVHVCSFGSMDAIHDKQCEEPDTEEPQGADSNS